MSNIYDTFDFGYDPDGEEPGPIVKPKIPSSLPASATVKPGFLPPVRKQTSPCCFVWASTYGIATVAAAQANQDSPSTKDRQASPTYTYIKVLQSHYHVADTCRGGQITVPLDYLRSNNGTPSLATAGNKPGCEATWAAYRNAHAPSDSRFAVQSYEKISVVGDGGLDNLRAIVSTGVPLAYGTRVFDNFPRYDGSPNPFVGKLPWKQRAGGGDAGHCMMIIGYDDEMGAVLIQNSFGSAWGADWNGHRGYVWMTYESFQQAAQGVAFYITAMKPSPAA